LGLCEEGKVPASTVAQAIDKYKLQADKINPLHA
jgi:pyruvate dehydrogenase complex dehydrogenase (E1) component